MNADDVKLCNCAGCDAELLGESMREWRAGLKRRDKEVQPPVVADRVYGRPYCRACLARLWPREFGYRVPGAR
jgi:hypothetical protein